VLDVHEIAVRPGSTPPAGLGSKPVVHVAPFQLDENERTAPLLSDAAPTTMQSMLAGHDTPPGVDPPHEVGIDRVVSDHVDPARVSTYD
jgi:hypothetical protein